MEGIDDADIWEYEAALWCGEIKITETYVSFSDMKMFSHIGQLSGAVFDGSFLAWTASSLNNSNE